LFDHDYRPIELDDEEFAFLQACEQNPQAPVSQLLETCPFSLDKLRSLQQRQLILLTP
jgi:hypothetical protein